jgi:hypothetical protein
MWCLLCNVITHINSSEFTGSFKNFKHLKPSSASEYMPFNAPSLYLNPFQTSLSFSYDSSSHHSKTFFLFSSFCVKPPKDAPYFHSHSKIPWIFPYSYFHSGMLLNFYRAIYRPSSIIGYTDLQQALFPTHFPTLAIIGKDKGHPITDHQRPRGE